MITKAITGTSGGNFESLTTTSTVTTNVTDDADATTVTLSSTTNGQAWSRAAPLFGGTMYRNRGLRGAPLVVSLQWARPSPFRPVSSGTATYAWCVRMTFIRRGTQTLAAVSISGTSGGNFEAVSTRER